MSSKVPPVPPQNRSPKGTGDPKKVVRDETPHGQQRVQKGQQGNIKQNTTNQRYQQDR
jgi:hypothetical protein